jgi:hypothetical protein
MGHTAESNCDPSAADDELVVVVVVFAGLAKKRK